MIVAPLTFSLSDRYEKRVGRVHLTGIQALARLPIDQARRDHATGLRTGTYVSGYEGSPLAGYDLELQRQTKLLDEHQPGEADSPTLPAGPLKHKPTAKLLQPVLGPLERDFMTTRMRIVEEYADHNELNRIVTRHPKDRVGIIASGKTFLDVQEALTKLGLDDAHLETAGIRLLKVGLLWPLSAKTILDFAEGLEEIIVVEEKRAFLETSVREILYGGPNPPVVTGKSEPLGGELFAPYGELDPDTIAVGLAKRLEVRDDAPTVRAWVAKRREERPLARVQLPLVQRAPYFCSGCPHNTATNSTVAMTGGQDAVGQMDVKHIVANLQSEGVARIIVTTDDVKSMRKARLPRDVAVWDRARIAEAERVLATTPGTTVLIHEQECATELRRKRKRGLAKKPTQAIIIKERLCEGCGDRGEKSNCLSVRPV